LRRRRTAAILATLLTLVTVSCRDASSAPEPAAKDRVTLNMLPSLSYAPFMIANDEGFFAAEGIDPVFVSLDLNGVMLAAASGELDVASSSVTAGVFNMMERGAPLRIVADKGHAAADGCASEAFVAPPDTASRILGNRSFRNETLALRRAGVTEYLIDRLLQREGLTRQDIRLTDLPPSEYLTAMEDKLDTVVYMQEPKLSQMTGPGLVRVVATAHEIDPGHPFSVVLFGKRLLRDDRDLGRRFMSAYLRGVRQYNLGKTDRNVRIISRHTKLPDEVIRSACWVAIATDGRIPSDAMNSYFEWAMSRGYLDRTPARDTWWDSSFIDAVASGSNETSPAAAH
jgi:NitT/TauT family transport system substrate-binding protein